MSVYYTTTRIVRIRRENYRVNTYEVEASLPQALPGQFVMLWLPRFDEKPMCIVRANPLWLSIAAVGDFTRRFAQLREGDEVSFRGPLGNSFWFDGGVKQVLMVGGGYGVAALNFLAELALARGIKPTMVIAARKSDDVILEKDFSEKGVEALVSTDDGSAGFKGRAHELVEELLKQGRKFDCICACGPEKMMHELARIAEREGIPSQLSLERYMGCGLGICGKCDCGGSLVCRDGPIFTGRQALALEDFGSFRRGTAGRKIGFG